MKRILVLLLLAVGVTRVTAQQTVIPELEQPRLVVGIVIDQMRWDYLTRYADQYCEGGFRRLMREGWNCNRTFINYLPAITAVGHTSVYTGTVPALNGIVGNNFYQDGQFVYCTADASVEALGALDKNGKPDPKAKAGLESPRNMLVRTMTDQLRLATNFRSKVIGVALKDRAAILPAGHGANAAYWMDGYSYNFISSTYYMKELPQWVRDFNARELGKNYEKQYLAYKNKKIKDGPWPLLLDREAYVQSAAPGQPWENTIDHTLKQSPWGQTITFDMAQAAIEGESLGHNPASVPDFLTISISSTDMLGHRVSPNSIWMEDCYLRLDRDIARFLSFLDGKVGQRNYLVFLTADHAGSHNVEFRREHNLPASTFPADRIVTDLDAALIARFPKLKKVVDRFTNLQIFFTQEALQSPDYPQILRAACDHLSALPSVAYAFSLRDIPGYVPEPIRTMTINGYNPQRCGQIEVIFQAGVTEDYASKEETDQPDHIYKGTTHSVWSPDDTHIPLIFSGWKVPHGWDNRPHYIVDIAATICALLNITEPDACVGHAVDFSVQQRAF